MLFVGENVVLGRGTGVDVAGRKVQNFEPINVFLTSASTSQVVWIIPTEYVSGTSNANYTWQILSVNVAFGTGSTSGTLQVEHLTGTQASGAGTAMLSSTLALSGTANTVETGTLSSSLTAAQSTFSPGDRVGLVIAGTMTSLANCVVQINMVRVS